MGANRKYKVKSYKRSYGFGTKRLEDYIDHVADKLDSYNKGYLNLDDIEKTLEEETGIKVINGDFKKK